MSARDTYVGDGLPEGAILLADKAQVVNQMGQIPASARGRVSGRASIGKSWLESAMQTPSAQASEISQIDSNIKLMDADMSRAMKERGQVGRPYDASDVITAATHGKAALDALLSSYHPAVSGDKFVTFYNAAWVPFFNRWAAFVHDNASGSWWSNPAAVAEGYYNQLLQLRQEAKGLGVTLYSPDPQHIDTSLPGANMLKTAMWVALGLGGAYVAVSVVNMAKGRRR